MLGSITHYVDIIQNTFAFLCSLSLVWFWLYSSHVWKCWLLIFKACFIQHVFSWIQQMAHFACRNRDIQFSSPNHWRWDCIVSGVGEKGVIETTFLCECKKLLLEITSSAIFNAFEDHQLLSRVTRFNIQKFWILPTEYIRVFCVDLKT